MTPFASRRALAAAVLALALPAAALAGQAPASAAEPAPALKVTYNVFLISNMG
ncbi:hypothetical protein ACFY8B_22315 [Streptomyces sp. NPDC012751]|uniref:hypothetical protein n=1 Tax=Streptomyces sp. NPDC012751 TaxID=3364846 RepID=UPI0036A2637C